MSAEIMVAFYNPSTKRALKNYKGPVKKRHVKIFLKLIIKLILGQFGISVPAALAMIEQGFLVFKQAIVQLELEEVMFALLEDLMKSTVNEVDDAWLVVFRGKWEESS